MAGRGLIFIFISMLLLISCGGEDAAEQEIESLDLEISFNRFDKDLFAYGESGNPVNVEELRNKYGSFVDLYVDLSVFSTSS